MEEIKDKKAYEISFVAVDEEDVKKLADVLKNAGAELVFESPLPRIRLAYPIEKREDAVFGYFHFGIEPEKIIQIEKQLRVQPVVLRFLVITPPFMKSKEKRQYAPRKKTAFAAPAAVAERKPAQHLSNEALEEQLKEISQ